jgi:outer membrane lipoprotein-sorting protein
MKKNLSMLVLLFILIGNYSFAQGLDGAKIMQNMKDKASQVQDYTADVEANINMENIRMPKIKMKIYFKAPDKFHYESKNFALLPKQGLNFNPMNYDEKNFDFNYLRSETLDNVPVHVVELVPKKVEPKKSDSKKKEKDKAPQVKSYIWVDANNWVPKKIGSEPNEKRNLNVTFEHSWFENKYYMPSKIFFSYEIPDIPEADIPKNPSEKGSKMYKGGKGGKGSVSITFVSYKINTGLSDDIFKEKAEK